MKINSFLTSILLLSSCALAQIDKGHIYNPECNYWQCGNNYTQNHSYEPDVFTWQYVTTPVNTNIRNWFFPILPMDGEFTTATAR